MGRSSSTICLPTAVVPAALVLAAVEAEGAVVEAKLVAIELSELDVEGSLSRQNDQLPLPNKPFDLVAKLMAVFSIVTVVMIIKAVFIWISMVF